MNGGGVSTSTTQSTSESRGEETASSGSSGRRLRFTRNEQGVLTGLTPITCGVPPSATTTTTPPSTSESPSEESTPTSPLARLTGFGSMLAGAFVAGVGGGAVANNIQEFWVGPMVSVGLMTAALGGSRAAGRMMTRRDLMPLVREWMAEVAEETVEFDPVDLENQGDDGEEYERY
ncbi:hypothetical protein V8F33_004312 [Rhypophila sp. PSN 637]